MSGKRHRISITLPVIAALVILLTVLAVLQYRWQGQISVAERQTMQTNLRNQSRGLQEEFNKEIDRATSRFEIGYDNLRNRSWDELAARYERWKTTTPYPGLIKSVYLATPGAGGQLALMRFNDATRGVEPAEWPESFADLRRRFEHLEGPTPETSEPERRVREERAGIGPLIEHGYVAEEVPAVVRLIIDRERIEKMAVRRTAGNRVNESPFVLQQFGLAIVELDLDYIKQVMAPALFDRRFSDDKRLDYTLTIQARDASDDKPDREKIAIASAGGENSAIRREKEKIALAYSNGTTASTPGDAVVNMFDLGLDSTEFNRTPRWQIVITHRAGSLDAAVAQARWRNLIASFGILFLLAASVVIVLINARRTQQLARKQMEFVAGVSHEFRTPLAVIHAISENLADGLITESQQVEQCGLVIRNDVRRLAGMVEQVLELAGAFSGKSLYQFQPVDLPELLEEVLAGYPMFIADQWSIEKQIEPGLPAVMADPAALASAVRNLVDNAVKYCGAGHWIRIKAETRDDEPARKVAVTVEDKGLGIPESEVSHIFEPFYRGREVRAAQLHGNGLGLSLVKNIVEAHGGTITVASVPGQGSAFTLQLPVPAPATLSAAVSVPLSEARP